MALPIERVKQEIKVRNGAEHAVMKQGLLQRLLRVIANLVIVVAALAAIWFGLQVFSTDVETVEEESEPETLATPVSLIQLQMEDAILVERRFLGRLEARQSADIGFEFGGKIASISVREGDRVKEGDAFASLIVDTLLVERAALQASLDAVQTQFNFAQAEAERIERLVSSGATQSSRLDQIEAERDTLASRLVEVESTVEQVDLRLQKSQLTAPFDGIIGASSANLGETVAAGQPIVSIFESGGADFRVGLPTSLDPMELRNPRIVVDEIEYRVSLKAVRPDIDFRTNTRTAIFEVKTTDLVSFGLSATLTGDVSLPLTQAHKDTGSFLRSATI